MRHYPRAREDHPLVEEANRLAADIRQQDRIDGGQEFEIDRLDRGDYRPIFDEHSTKT